MKAIRIAVLLMFFFLPLQFVSAQGNTLVFNQVLTFSGNSITSSPYTIATVPAGRIWKIEHITGKRSSYPAPIVFNTGGSENDPSDYQVNSENHLPGGPVWLKAGDIIKIYWGSSSYPASYFISVIEFIPVPNP